jgi:hypothetical protein
MNQQELVEAVLREVKRALAERGLTVGSAPEAKPAATPVRTGFVSAASAADSVGNDLTGKQVIVLKDLQTLGSGAVRVGRTAVVTPLAVDYAREKGITIVRVESSQKKDVANAATGAGTAGLVVCSDFPAGGMVRSILEEKGFAVREFAGQTYEAAVTAMCAAVASGSALFGVCLERTGLQGPVHANRNRLIRAVHCRDTFEARAARVDIGANVVVLDSQSDPSGVLSGFTGLE